MKNVGVLLVLIVVAAASASAQAAPKKVGSQSTRRYVNLPNFVQAPFSDGVLVGNTLYIAGRLVCVVALFASAAQREETPKEAPVIIFRDAGGRKLLREDLRKASGTFTYEFPEWMKAPEEAQALHENGRKAGASGDYKSALALFEKAAHIAPQWPYPIYDTAFTYLLMGDSNAALTYYRKTLELAPRGFFTAITAVDALTREQEGDLPAGTYKLYVLLESAENREGQHKALQQLVKLAPGFAPAWQKLAGFQKNDAEMLKAIDRGLSLNPDAETKGMLQINRALLVSRRGSRDEAIRVLGELALDPKSPADIEHLAKISLASIFGP